QAMEKVLEGMHSLRNAPGNLREKWWDGEVTRWFALEMVSFGGEIHFYVRIYHKQRNLVEAAFFSYYPDIEIVEAEDYVDKFPSSVKEMNQQGFDLWGSEMVYDREEAYPIKTYFDFESPEEEKQFDPISVFLEVLGKIKKEEIVGIQILIAPADLKWYRAWEGLLSKMKEPKVKKEKSESQVETFARLIARSPGETDVLKAVEKNLSKPAFDTILRFIYLAPKKGFYDSYARRGLAGAFNQYASLDMNKFRQNYTVSTRTQIWYYPFIFPVRRNDYRKQRLLYTFIHREVPPETWMGRFITSYVFNLNFASRYFKMNTECLATIFHPPTFTVLTAPHVKRVESRKASPPAGLAIFGDEKAIEKFK
ncbi:MAG TPA: hypothetical protein VJB92_01805, partial [Candidatus Paceibacterota bacterium]